MRAITYIVAAVAMAGVGGADAMKSDPANYYLDPEEIRPIVRDSIETTIMLNSGHEKAFFHSVEVFDIRLIPGQLPLYTIDGHVAAYLYIAYALPGPLPTFEDIISGAVESYQAREDFRLSANRSNWRQFYMDTFPYFLTCGFEIVGVNGRWPGGLGSIELPRFVMNQGKGEEAARRYFGNGDYTLVRYIYCSKLNGYEYTDGSVNIIVPFDTWTGEVDADNVMLRADVDTRIDEYRWTPDAAKLEFWFGMWQKKLAAERK